MLQDIRSDLAEIEGFDSADADEKSTIDRLINRACKELYDEHYLYLAERERIVDFGSDNQQITLPWDVDKLIAARRYTNRDKLNLEDMRPRYRSDAWKERGHSYPWLNVRFKQRTPLQATSTNFGPLTCSVPVAESADVKITIVGSTLDAERVREQITLTAGSTSVAFTTSFTNVLELKKDVVTANDIVVKDLEEVELTRIPNHLLKASYPVYQILDRHETFGTTDTFVEILYKLPFQPLVNDEDSFLDDYYDNAIYHKCREYMFEGQENKDNERIRAAQKAEANISKVNKQLIPDGESRVKYPTPLGTTVLRAVRAGLAE